MQATILGYGDATTVWAAELMPSGGAAARADQEKAAADERNVAADPNNGNDVANVKDGDKVSLGNYVNSDS